MMLLKMKLMASMGGSVTDKICLLRAEVKIVQKLSLYSPILEPNICVENQRFNNKSPDRSQTVPPSHKFPSLCFNADNES
jgi:hypothetical protein